MNNVQLSNSLQAFSQLGVQLPAPVRESYFSAAVSGVSTFYAREIATFLSAIAALGPLDLDKGSAAQPGALPAVLTAFGSSHSAKSAGEEAAELGPAVLRGGEDEDEAELADGLELASDDDEEQDGDVEAEEGVAAVSHSRQLLDTLGFRAQVGPRPGVGWLRSGAGAGPLLLSCASLCWAQRAPRLASTCRPICRTCS
jgi:hypothetical protein